MSSYTITYAATVNAGPAISAMSEMTAASLLQLKMNEIVTVRLGEILSRIA